MCLNDLANNRDHIVIQQSSSIVIQQSPSHHDPDPQPRMILHQSGLFVIILATRPKGMLMADDGIESLTSLAGYRCTSETYVATHVHTLLDKDVSFSRTSHQHTFQQLEPNKRRRGLTDSPGACARILHAGILAHDRSGDFKVLSRTPTCSVKPQQRPGTPHLCPSQEFSRYQSSSKALACICGHC